MDKLFENIDFEKMSPEELTKLATQMLAKAGHKDIEFDENGNQIENEIEITVDDKFFDTANADLGNENIPHIDNSSVISNGMMPRCNARITSINQYQGNKIDE